MPLFSKLALVCDAHIVNEKDKNETNKIKNWWWKYKKFVEYKQKILLTLML